MIREILWPIRANEFDGVEEFRERRDAWFRWREWEFAFHERDFRGLLLERSFVLSFSFFVE